ncbi:MAG TPA: M66 family metalloprotease [Polyangiaceae bacterium]|nr:M66 family metalloprotease [Polyangiaceae bacterium]
MIAHSGLTTRAALTGFFAALISSCTGVIEPQPDSSPGIVGGGQGATQGKGGSGSGGTVQGGGTAGAGGSAGSAGSAALLPLWTGSMGSWCGPGDNATLWLVSSKTASACMAQSAKIYGEMEDTTEGLVMEVPSASITTLPATLTVPSRYCTAGVCSDVTVTLKVDTYTQGVGATGSWSLTPPGGMLVEGRLEAGWCTWDEFLPPHPQGMRLARDIKLAEVAVYQGVKIPIMTGMLEVPERNADLVQNREALVRVFVEPGPAFTAREIAARITLQTGDAEPVVVEETMQVSGASSEEDTSSTFNLMLPKEAFGEGTQYTVELRETSKCTELAGVAMGARFPETGTLPVDAIDTGPVKVLLVPVRFDADGSGRVPDTGTEAMAQLKDRVYAMYPTGEVILTLHEPVGTSATDLGDMLDQMRNLRDEEEPPSDLSYYGLVDMADSFQDYCNQSCTTGIAGFGSQNGEATAGMGIGFIDYAAGTFAHELGHIHRLPHAPCGGPADPDPEYPYDGAGIGSWGYDVLTQELFSPSEYVDLMSYCSPDWVSDYNYQLLLERVITVNENAGNLKVLGTPPPPQEWRSLRVDAAGNVRWGLSVHPRRSPPGDPTTANILDAQGIVLQQVVAYVELASDDSATYFVPAQKAGWHAVQIGALPAHAYGAPSNAAPFTR